MTDATPQQKPPLPLSLILARWFYALLALGFAINGYIFIVEGHEFGNGAGFILFAIICVMGIIFRWGWTVAVLLSFPMYGLIQFWLHGIHLWFPW